MSRHVHSYVRDGNGRTARCIVKGCKVVRRLEDLVYLGYAPRSVGMGSGWHSWRL